MEKTKKVERKIGKDNEKKTARALIQECNDKNCNTHGNLKTRGRIFKGRVIRKFPKRVVIEFERMIYVRKYERYKKGRTKIHARLPSCMDDSIQMGDHIRVQECRPLSKLVHFIVLGKVKEEQK